MTIWFASGNKHKQGELAEILGDHKIVLPDDAGITNFDPDESGATFAENALLKARELYRLLSNTEAEAEPVLADDSGLCVDALGGRPGIYSARYYGKDSWGADSVFKEKPDRQKLNDKARNLLLLEELDAALSSSCARPALPRSCRFVCAMVLLFSPDRFYLVQETLEGEIVSSASAIRGTGGFGYDPIMYIPELDRTVAELSEAEKNVLSHRGKAGKTIAKLLAAGVVQ